MNGIIAIKITAAYDMHIHTSFCSVNCCCCLLLQTTIKCLPPKKADCTEPAGFDKNCIQIHESLCLYNLSLQSHDPSPQKDMTLPVASSTTLKIKQTKRRTVDHACKHTFLIIQPRIVRFK
jgi:hypothetical protein